MTPHCREATTADIATITAFQLRLAEETEPFTLDAATVERGVRRGMTERRGATYYVAEQDDRVIASLLTTREWSDWRDGYYVWIGSVYVHADYRRRGVFTALLNFAVDAVRRDPDTIGLRLYHEHDNAAAVATYRSLKFADAGYGVMERLFV